MDKKQQISLKQRFERLFANIGSFDTFLEQKVDVLLLRFINILRYFFIIIMILYLIVCLTSLSHKIISFTISQGALDFPSIKVILTDALFTLIVLAIVKTLFLRSAFDYALTFLETGFVVIIRKLILLEATPEDTLLLMVLGVTSSVFFILIIYIHNLKRQWRLADCLQDKEEQKNSK